MKITFEFGRRGQHSVRKQNELLLATVETLTEQLVAAKVELADTREQLNDALADRLARGHQMRQGLRVIQGGPARFQLER